MFRLTPVAIGVLAVAGRAETPRVVIEGGADATGHTYNWVVTNSHTSAVTYIEFPHYRANLFFAPDAWITESTSLVNVGVKDSPGVCTAEVKSAADGIAPGRSAKFTMQVAAAGAKRGRGEVLARFADGSSIRVAGVELPVRESVGDRYIPLMGMGTVVVVLLAVRAARGRRRAAHQASAGEGS